MIKRHLFLACLSVLVLRATAQDVALTMKEAENFEKQLKEDAALEKYKTLALADSTYLPAVLKAAELSCSAGARLKDVKARQPYYEQALKFAGQAYTAKPDDAQVNYVMSLASSKMAELDLENKRTVQFIRHTKLYADKALAVNPNHGKANYMAGKWNLDMTNTSWLKKVAAKTIYGGGIQPATIDSAIAYMEKCRVAEPYYVQNYLDLAKAYKQDNKPAKAIEVLNRLVKLPVRTPDDAALKAEGKTMLDGML